ncbi:MAG: GNAT family N-acetyltransferase [Oligoflexus sp.]
MSLSFSFHKSIHDFTADQWDLITPADFPFWDYEFLSSLEQSHTIGERTGWYPCFVVAKQNGEIQGSLPLYIKTNSYGEYIFDWQWAEAYAHSGIPYYPKLVSAVPFTPANGPKILLRKDCEQNHVAEGLIAQALKLMRRQNFSSLHSLFLADWEAPLWQAQGLKLRTSYQYHWLNEGYRDFADFLSQLKGKRRRQILRERQQVSDAGLNLKRLSGEQLQAEHGSLFYQFYLQTIDKKSAIPYLTEDFFKLAVSRMRDRCLLILAKNKSEQLVAASLSFLKGKVIYGRYWGCIDHYPSLHFELCYYQLIEHAIQTQMVKVEAGAQGEHKIQRGFRPTRMLSAHAIADARFQLAIDRYIDEEEKLVEAHLEQDARHLPFRS